MRTRDSLCARDFRYDGKRAAPVASIGAVVLSRVPTNRARIAVIPLTARAREPMLDDMLIIPPPTSNAERQRQFVERNPGYYRKYSAQRRALEKEARERFLAAARAKAQAEKQAAERREPLLLPAPVETIEIPGMNKIEPAPVAAAVPAAIARPLPEPAPRDRLQLPAAA
jgi:hypothetical protein